MTRCCVFVLGDYPTPVCCPALYCVEAQAVNKWVWEYADPAWRDLVTKVKGGKAAPKVAPEVNVRSGAFRMELGYACAIAENDNDPTCKKEAVSWMEHAWGVGFRKFPKKLTDSQGGIGNV